MFNIIISVNESQIENLKTSDFFLPFYGKKSKVMIAGNGQQCCIKSFVVKCTARNGFAALNSTNTDNRDTGNVYSGDKRNCDCCIIS